MLPLALALTLVWASGFLLGIFALYYYIILRMIRSDGWDHSNITNGQRLLSHVALHPEDFGKMYYLTPLQQRYLLDNDPTYREKRPFWYIDQDEFQGVVRTRP